MEYEEIGDEMANVVETLERVKRLKDEINAVNTELKALGEPSIYDVADIPITIRFLEKRIKPQDVGPWNG